MAGMHAACIVTEAHTQYAVLVIVQCLLLAAGIPLELLCTTGSVVIETRGGEGVVLGCGKETSNSSTQLPDGGSRVTGTGASSGEGVVPAEGGGVASFEGRGVVSSPTK